MYLPRKPTLTETSLSDKDYCELSTKFKACHIKIMVFWVAKKTQEVADGNPQVSRFNYMIFLGRCPPKITPMQTSKGSISRVLILRYPFIQER